MPVTPLPTRPVGDPSKLAGLLAAHTLALEPGIDSVNNPTDIQNAFLQYYTEAHVETATDPNLVHQLATKLAQPGIYTRGDVERYAEAWWGQQRHSALAAAITPARDEFANRWAEAVERNDSEALNELRTFRKDCGSYIRLYDFMSQVIDFETTDLEKLAEFLRQLVRLLAVDDPRRCGRVRDCP